MGCRAWKDIVTGLVLCYALVSCSFDTSSPTLFDDGSLQERLDAGSAVDAAGADSSEVIEVADAHNLSDCPEPIHIEVQVNGVSAPPQNGQPYVHSLLGDTVALSAIGSCTQSGTLTYDWTIEPLHLSETAEPTLSSETLSVYSTLANQQHTVRLQVSDGTGASQTKVFFAFDVAEFVPLPTIPDHEVTALHAGATFLWIGGEEGAYRGDLASPGALTDISNLYGGDHLPEDISAVYESSDGAFVWFGTSESKGRVYRLDTGTNTVKFFNTIVDSKTRALSGATMGVRVGTNRGVVFAPNNQNFSLERADAANALSVGSQGAFAGGNLLYPLPSGSAIHVFGSENNKIRGITDDGARLWDASDGKGVASLVAGQVDTLYTSNTSRLISNAVRAITVDADGDIWVATKAGVSRFKADRQVWLAMSGDSGLSNRTDVKVITIDETGGRRAIYVGGKKGLSMMRTP